MEEMNKPKASAIDYIKVWNAIKQRKKLFYKTLSVAFVIGCIYSLSIPRFYITEVKLAPEMENSGTGGALSSIASSFGFDLSEMQTTDAITPLLYPELMEDNGFIADLFNVKVTSKDGSINTTYKEYLSKYQKTEWWNYPLGWIKNLFKKKTEGDSKAFDPYFMSKHDDDIAGSIRNNITCKADKKTGVITIKVKAQDPLICKTIADSTKEHLQQFITNYRTNKARTDYEYYKRLADDAKREYEKKRQIYANMTDANSKIALRSVELKLEDMENDLQLMFNAYSTINTQLQAAKAKVQERTPAFTVIKGAAVPIKHAGPKRMIMVLMLLIFTFIGTSLYILRDILHPKSNTPPCK